MELSCTEDLQEVVKYDTSTGSALGCHILHMWFFDPIYHCAVYRYLTKGASSCICFFLFGRGSSLLTSTPPFLLKSMGVLLLTSMEAELALSSCHPSPLAKLISVPQRLQEPLDDAASVQQRVKQGKERLYS